MTINLKILTLNCWGLPFPVICKNRVERIKGIAEYLCANNYDLVVLEEIWVKSDFHYLKDKLATTMMHSHYFYSGAIGSGVCIFSKHPIVETSFHRFHLNGHAHKIFHGDWFGGKGVGLAKIHVGDFDVYLYCSHFHAEYNPGNDEYHAHRITQSFELGQFIKSTREGSDLVVVAGDLNTPPGCLGYRIITMNPKLKDCWEEKNNTVDNNYGGTCDIPGNSYTSLDSLKSHPNGERIDYVMFGARKGYTVDVICETGLGKIPGAGLSFSDHEAVMATLTITKTGGNIIYPEEKTGMNKELKDALQESLFILDKGISQCLSEQKFFKLMLFLMCFVLYVMGYQLDQSVTGGGAYMGAVMALAKLIVAIGVGFCLWTSLIVKRAEFYGLVGAKEDISRLLQYGGSRSRGF